MDSTDGGNQYIQANRNRLTFPTPAALAGSVVDLSVLMSSGHGHVHQAAIVPDKRKHRPRTLRRIAKRKSDRELTIEKFGELADERKQEDRRKHTAEENEKILKDIGITDRRRMDRRGKESW